MTRGAWFRRFLCITALCGAVAKVVLPQEQTRTVRGTVNIALANKNGLVLLTDSAESHQERDGWHHTSPVQKLFRLDDKTICSIAGFASEKGWPQPQFDTYVSGIIADVRDQLAQKPVEEVDGKIAAVAFLVAHYINLIINRQSSLSEPNTFLNPDNYKFEVIAAGFETGGALKLRKLVVTSRAVPNPNGSAVWTETVSPEDAVTEQGMSHLLGGIPVVSQAVLDNPNKFMSRAAIKRYASFKAAKKGKALSLSELEALAREMVALTSSDPRFAGFVGGPDQVAVLSDDKVQKFDQPNFPPPPRPMNFSLMVGLEVTRAVMFLAAPGTHLLWIKSTFIGIRNPPLVLDNQFFFGCEIRDSIVQYGGGFTELGPTNKVVDTMLLPGRGASESSFDNFSKIWNAFAWRPTPPEAPPLTSPPIVSPRQPH
jgi:hypothetical protein